MPDAADGVLEMHKLFNLRQRPEVGIDLNRKLIHTSREGNARVALGVLRVQKTHRLTGDPTEPMYGKAVSRKYDRCLDESIRSFGTIDFRHGKELLKSLYPAGLPGVDY